MTLLFLIDVSRWVQGRQRYSLEVHGGLSKANMGDAPLYPPECYRDRRAAMAFAKGLWGPRRGPEANAGNVHVPHGQSIPTHIPADAPPLVVEALMHLSWMAGVQFAQRYLFSPEELALMGGPLYLPPHFSSMHFPKTNLVFSHKDLRFPWRNDAKHMCAGASFYTSDFEIMQDVFSFPTIMFHMKLSKLHTFLGNCNKNIIYPNIFSIFKLCKTYSCAGICKIKFCDIAV